MAQIGTDFARALPPFGMLLDEGSRRRLMARQTDWSSCCEAIRQERTPRSGDAVQNVTRFDFMNYMPDQILTKVDRASMLAGLEVRAPFLDVPVIEFAFSRVPSRLKASLSDRKIILKKLASRLLPKGFDLIRKQGFDTPLAKWLISGPWRRLFEEVLFDPGCIFAHSEIRRLFKGLEAGRPLKEPLFGLVLFELWRREYGVTL